MPCLTLRGREDIARASAGLFRAAPELLGETFGVVLAVDGEIEGVMLSKPLSVVEVILRVEP